MKTRKICFVVGAVLALGGTGVYADTVLFDHDQSGPFSPADGFDWLPGNALAVDALNDGVLNVGDTFTTYYQAELGSFSDGGAGVTTLPTGSAGPYEYTGVAIIQEEVTQAIDLNADSIVDLVQFKHVGGTFKMYYDDFGGTNADGFGGNSGLGYDDGKLILSADVDAGGSTFSLSNPQPVALDQFGSDDLPGIQTVTGNGNTNVDAKVTFVDSNFLKGVDIGDMIVTLKWDSTLATPFDSVNPEKSVVGNTPDYGADNINGLDTGAAGKEDFHFEADGNMSFKTKTVPEPASLALVSLGLLGMGAFSRKRSA